MKLHTKILLLGAIGTLLITTGVVVADRYEDLEHAHGSEHEYDDDDRVERWFGGSKEVISPVQSGLYRDECGSCHFAYQPGLLPAASWERILSGLEDHFGENAELGQEDTREIREYLLNHAAGQVEEGLPNRISASLADSGAPLRITQTRFFVHEHDEIPRRMVEDNDQVRSFSQCDACHTRAVQGSFREHQIEIPGFGHWDD